MRIALIDSNPKPKMYPLPLLKIGAWRKSLGDQCVIFNNRLPEKDEFDEIWITTTFTFDVSHALGIVREAKNRASRVLVGGVASSLLPKRFESLGVEVHVGIHDEIESMHPDYSLLDTVPTYSISHTSRGCVRKCGFCMVNRLEPKFFNRKNWENDIHPDADQIVFYDNNWFAKGFKGLKEDVKKLEKIISNGKIKTIDFNQGLDARLLTEKIADLLKGLPIIPVRFAFDDMSEDGFYQNAVMMMNKRGFNDFSAYVLYNYNDTPQDFYYRLRESVRLQVELKIRDVRSFPMRYQPIFDIDKRRKYVGRNWNVAKRGSFKAILAQASTCGQVSSSTIKEFEYWFGRDADEFDKLLSYPKIRELSKRKKGALRTMRAKGEWL